MLQPAEMEWYQPKTVNDPSPRSGHSLTVVGNGLSYMFGGVTKTAKGPTNEMFKLDTSDKNTAKWTKVEKGNMKPLPRWHHTATYDGRDTIILFGGYSNDYSGTFGKKKPLKRYHNDIWLFDIKTEIWSQPTPGIVNSEGELIHPWDFVPTYRGSHGACLVEEVVYEDVETVDENGVAIPGAAAAAAVAAANGQQEGESFLRRRLFVFGGYGDAPGTVMFGRTDYNDLHALDLDTWEWEEIEATGELPEERSSCQMVYIPRVVPPNEAPTSPRIYVSGGWNSMNQFQDLFVLDVETLVWTEVTSASKEKWGPERWEHSMVAARAVPHWKVFNFGGKVGDLSYETGMPVGNFNNELTVLETGSSTADLWVKPNTIGKTPGARSDSPVAFDSYSAQLIMFGGWSNRWLGDLWICKVRDVVGPPYSIHNIDPKIGAVTGATECIVHGMGFLGSKGDASMSVACAKGAMEVLGTVTSDTSLTFITPDYTQFGSAQDVQCRLKIGPGGLTNTAVELKLFEVTSPDESIVFGPGVIDGCAAGDPVSIVIQAKDKYGNDRWCGMDEFTIKVVREPTKDDRTLGIVDVDIDVEIEDAGNGSYVATYTLPREGTYTCDVRFEGSFAGKKGPCRGSPFVFKALQGKDLAQKTLADAKLAFDNATKALESAKKKHTKLKEVADADITNDKAQSAEIEASIKLEKAQTQQTEIENLLKQAEAKVPLAQDKAVNDLYGSLHIQSLKSSIKEIKTFSTSQLQALKESNSKDELDPLVRVKRSLAKVENGKKAKELSLASNRAALRYLKQTTTVKEKIKELDRLHKDLEVSQDSWDTTKKEIPSTTRRIANSNGTWTDKVEKSVEEFTKVMENRVYEYKNRKMWTYNVGVEEAVKDMALADYWLTQQSEEMQKNAELCSLFEFPDLINEAKSKVDLMRSWLCDMQILWKSCKTTQDFIKDSKCIKWNEMNVDDLEDGAKKIMKMVKSCSKDVRWSNAFISLDKSAKDFMNTVPLIQNLGNKAMRPRHWDMIMKVTKKEFTPPHADENMLLEQIIDLNLHEFTADVDEICDQSQKEDKMEKQLQQLNERYATLEWASDPYKSDATVPLLKMDGDQFEQLEADQLAVGGMLANRYVAQFQTECDGWRASLNNIADGFGMFTEIQRTWSYLEPLFIGSEEVKKELPQDAATFAAVDIIIREMLRSTFKIKNMKESSDVPGLIKKLEGAMEQLNVCKKALKDFLEGRQRQFPRYFFIAEADLLDILSNGSEPRKILHHTPKVYLCAKTFTLDKEDDPKSGRPIATQLVAGVGKEVTNLEPPVVLEGKVEQYMEELIRVIKITMFENLKRSLTKYASMDRVDWLMHRMDGSCAHHKPERNDKSEPSDPAQIILLVLAIYYVQEVEEAFAKLADGEVNAMKEYNQKQITQIKALISMAIKVDTKGDMMRIMVCITMDAHNRDCVKNKLVQFDIQDVTSFQWQSQLKHKYRVPPPQASFIDMDPHLRSNKGERAEVAICDAIIPYDYEYLGNGFRLVITPLTDRIYVTATQALNLAMGCAPAGPAGTGKTESVKDLSNALAKLVYVLNCSPDMDYKSLGAVWQGVSSSGAWICFDEFNRLIPEVLSVCTVQFKSVCDGIKGHSARVTIEGSEVKLNPSCGAYITMNPGYLGRSELPEGLKALFRPITVMVPDLVLICENFLMAQGFEDAQVLASKFYGLYSLLADLLSKQMHYDWGLRAVKSVLYVAGGFKRASPDMNEQELLMRALRDFNIPKIIKEDEVVFYGLLGDLFPGLDPPRSLDPDLEANVLRACVETGLDPDEVFRLKVVQLEELTSIRHCTFMMGPNMSGKSSCWQTLVKARTYEPGGDRITYVHDISAKVMLTQDLYGYTSLATREWQDGVLSKIMRDLGQMDDKPKWIMLDGDLDANWIESMNSVMDDNKILTLPSNERIPLKENMKMIFEIRDLKYATPATVSRAGILYISADDGTQWRSCIKAWLSGKAQQSVQFPESEAKKLTEEQKGWLQACFDKYCWTTLRWLKINTIGIIPLQDMNRIATLLFMLDGLLSPKTLENAETIEQTFCFCCVWAMGSALTISDDGTDYRKMFSDWWRSEFKTVKFPPRDSVFEYWLNAEEHQFDQWTKSPYFYSIDYESTTSMNSVTVPTPETCSVTFWMSRLLDMRRGIMLCGPAGTGKTQMVKGLLGSQNPDEVVFQPINFSFYTNSDVCYANMDAPLEKKTGVTFGPPGNRRLVYFLDDINLPEVDKYGTQRAIELCRQQIEYEHMYDMSKLSRKNVINTQMVACMNPTAGSFLINPRLQRWFATFAIGLPGPVSLMTIYQTFLDGHLKNFESSLDDKFSINLIKGALNLHSQVAYNFRKTAANFHYEFNIRHIANVFQGLLVAQPAQFTEPDKFVCLWIHESERVYGDRLVSGADLEKYNTLAQAAAKKAFPSVNIARYYSKENSEALVFCHFAENMNDKIYNQISSIDHMSKTLNDALHEYNETNATMDLVLFEDAMKHVARIVRIILNPSGHALLVGVGGSGKQSLTKLASFICTYTVFQIQISSTYSINDFKEDLKIMHNKAGVKEEGITFLLTDSQITNERFLIFINDLLASGDVPDLFAPDEVDGISNALVSRCKAAGIVPDKKNLWNFFINEIRANLHVVLAFSPVGDDFRNRAKKFPALVNCTVIDWFQPWPKQALFAVGQKFMNEVPIKLPSVRAAIEKFLPFSFGVVQDLAEKFKRVERRFVYMTPKSYLELLKLYGGLLEQKRHLQDEGIERLGNGLTKLNDTAATVGKLQTDLAVMVEDAEKKKETAEGIAEVVSREKAVVEVETAKAQKEAAIVAIVEKEVSAKAADTKADLDKAEPAVEQAMAALDSLEKKDISNCKGMNVPPPGVGEVFGATMVLLSNIIPSVPVGKTGKVKAKDLEWGPSKKILLGDIDKYIENLKHVKVVVDSSTFPEINRSEIQPFLDLETFDADIIKTKNSAAGGLCSFVINIITYYDIVVTVEPKRIALAAANKELAEAQEKLRAVNEHVANLEAKLAKLTAEFNAANAEKMAAINAVENGNRKLDLAQRLIQALAAEGERWAITVDEMNESRDLLTGDVLLASAFISYVGPFTKEFREELMGKHFTPFLLKEFTTAVGEDGIPPISQSADPVSILSNGAEIATWNSQSLPSDPVSSENGCIVTNSARWPLMIDPQLQGIRWIRNLEGDPERELQIVRLDQKDMIRKMERALENGKSVLIENMGETMEAVLNPVIQRAAIKRGKKKYLKLGDTEVELHPEFKLYLHTKLSNPHYPPEIQAECTLVNFMVTFSGLEDQLLSLVVRKEQPDLAALGEKLITQQNGYKIKMRELEDHILYKLATAEGDITEDVELIEGLEESKRVADEIGRKAAKAHETQTAIGVTSEKYRSVANRTSLLFFLMGDLVKIHTYYIYSLAAFTKVFFRGIDIVTSEEARSRQATAELERARVETDGDGNNDDDGDKVEVQKQPSEGEVKNEEEEEDDDAAGGGKLLSDEEMADRCKVLIDSITLTVFDYIRRGLFERHKLTISTMLALRVATNDGWLDNEQVGLLVNGNINLNPGSMGMLDEWMLPIIFKRLKALEVSPEFKGLCDQLQEDAEEWGLWFMNGKAEECKMPSGFDKSLSDYSKLAFLRAIRPDRLPAALTKWLGQVMGKNFIEQPPFSMDTCFQETSNQTPVFFVLFPGVDPTPWVEKLAGTLGLSIANGKFTNISMGQGQEKPAEALVHKFAKEGGWVMLQNLHLMQDWVPSLERLLEIVQENAHDLFRCFISAEPPGFDYFKNMPESLMQSCIKVANEAPADVKSNLKRAWDKFGQDRIDASTKPTEFKGTLFALCWFHAIVCGRRRFGPQGWSRAYSFNDGDLTICAQVLFLYLDTNPTVPWEDLRYIFGEIMYGGHITDPWDRVQSASYLQIYITEALFNGFELAPGFKAPDVADMSYDDVFDYMNDKLPAESPVLFGLHPNAEIGYLETMTGNIFNTVLNIGGGAGSGGGNDGVKAVMDGLIEQLPESFVMVIVLETATPKLSGPHSPYVVVAMQECGRMNALLNEMRLSLTDLDKGLKGQLNMTDIMEDMITALSINEWPGRNPFSKCMWEKNAWPSKKGLQSQFLDLLERFRVIKAWSDTMDSPLSLWLPGLFNPTAYLTAIKQVTARATMKPLDNMTNETHFTTMYDCSDPKEYPEDGMYIHGLFMEGSRWSTLEESAEIGPPIKVGITETFGHIMDSHLKELLPVMPLMYVKAVPVQPHWQAEGVGFLRNDPRVYECPVFITLNRGATYVFLATLNTNQPVTKWVLTGTALIMQTPN